MDRNAHRFLFCLSLSSSAVTHTPQALSRLVASVLSGPRPPCWIQWAALSVTGAHVNMQTHTPTHTGCYSFLLWQKGSMLSFQCDFLPSPHPHPHPPTPAIFVPSALSALPLLLVSSHMATPALLHVIPQDSFPMFHPLVGHTNSSKCTTQPQDHRKDKTSPIIQVFTRLFIYLTYCWRTKL